jgi:hypothetical protein
VDEVGVGLCPSSIMPVRCLILGVTYPVVAELQPSHRTRLASRENILLINRQSGDELLVRRIVATILGKKRA